MTKKTPDAVIPNQQAIIDLVAIILSALDDQDSDYSFLLSMGSLRPEDITESDHQNTESIRELLEPILKGHTSPYAAVSVDDLNGLIDVFGNLLAAGLINGIPRDSAADLFDAVVDHASTVCIGLEKVGDDAKKVARAANALLKKSKSVSNPKNKIAKPKRTQKKA